MYRLGHRFEYNRVMGINGLVSLQRVLRPVFLVTATAFLVAGCGRGGQDRRAAEPEPCPASPIVKTSQGPVVEAGPLRIKTDHLLNAWIPGGTSRMQATLSPSDVPDRFDDVVTLKALHRETGRVYAAEVPWRQLRAGVGMGNLPDTGCWTVFFEAPGRQGRMTLELPSAQIEATSLSGPLLPKPVSITQEWPLSPALIENLASKDTLSLPVPAGPYVDIHVQWGRGGTGPAAVPATLRFFPAGAGQPALLMAPKALVQNDCTLAGKPVTFFPASLWLQEALQSNGVPMEGGTVQLESPPPPLVTGSPCDFPWKMEWGGPAPRGVSP